MTTEERSAMSRLNDGMTHNRPSFKSWMRRASTLALSAALASILLTTSASAWWNDEWSMRKKVSIDTSSTGAAITDAIGSQAVLIRLHVGNFRFAAAKEDGSDLRFVSADDKTPLKHHIEKYDALLGEALVWVHTGELQPGAKSDIWLYYGNKKAVATGDPKATYGSETALVYHFAERGTPAQDSTVWMNNAQTAGQAADGSLIGLGLRLDGVTPVTIPATAALAFAQDSQLTWSAWVKPAALQRNSVIYSRRDGANAFVVGMDDGAPFLEISVNGAVHRTAAAAPVAPGGWHHVAVVVTPGLATLYLDGNAYGSISSTLPALNTIALLGGDSAAAVAPAPVSPAPVVPAATAADPNAAPAADGSAAVAEPALPAPAAAPAPAPSARPGFAGDIDELMIIKAARPAGFIKALVASQGTDPSKFIVFSVDEETSSWLTGYFGILLKSVTFDGWVVIAILLVMGVASWIVMVEKHGYLSRQKKGNNAFTDRFRNMRGDLTTLLGADTVPDGKRRRNPLSNSSLFRIYKIGAQEIRGRFPDDAQGSTHPLSAEAIAAIRAALDAGLVRELQQLNRLMVVLTISISGGPFLGLLGTVMGVMITFAAIAMSGDVNINAIAPGVAGALVATVAGLSVAIPALFGYNWLTLRIRDLTSDMQVFVDEFTTKLAETYTADRPRKLPMAAE